MDAQYGNTNAAIQAMASTPPTDSPQPPPPPPAAQSGAAQQAAQAAGSGWTEPRTAAPQRQKSPVLACLLSLMPGLGQIYVGYYRQGFVHIAIVATLITILASEAFILLSPMFGIFLAFFFLYNIVDAGRRATLYNQAVAGMEGVSMPEEISLPTPGGSLFGGVVLIVVGTILLSNTLLDFRLDWLEDWWPAAPIALGVYLVAKDLMERSKKDA